MLLLPLTESAYSWSQQHNVYNASGVQFLCVLDFAL